LIRKIKLKWQISALFIGLGLLMVGGYSFLTAHYLMLGMDSAMVASMERAAQGYRSQDDGGSPSLESRFFFVTSSWQEQPGDVRQVIIDPPEADGVLRKNHREDEQGQRERMYFAMRFTVDNDVLFVSHVIYRKHVSDLVSNTIRENLNGLIVISAASALFVALIVLLAARRIGRPVSRLGRWARSLDTQSLRDPLPDFRYPELNELAELVRSSLSSLEGNLEREHRFLKHTSHELRTPISVIRNSTELIYSLPKAQLPADGSVLLSIIERIDRASLTMKHLTETLLWLSRDKAEKLPCDTVALDELIRDLVDEHRYLLRDKAVTVNVDTEALLLALPSAAARIVIGNLIRNAFQHTWAGGVVIRQKSASVYIDNYQTGEDDVESDLGFGLGMQLTAQLAERLQWHYSNEVVAGGHRVCLDLGMNAGENNTCSHRE